MNKVVKNGVLLSIGALSLASCGKKALKEENAFLKIQVNTYKIELDNVQQMLEDANSTIENNILKIADLELNVDTLTNEINALYSANDELNNLITSLYNDIETLNEIILDHEDNITRINSLLVIEMENDSINQIVINQLNDELFTLQADYDHLVANPLVITEARVRVVETILEVEAFVEATDTVTAEEFNELLEVANGLESALADSNNTIEDVIAYVEGQFNADQLYSLAWRQAGQQAIFDTNSAIEGDLNEFQQNALDTARVQLASISTLFGYLNVILDQLRG